MIFLIKKYQKAFSLIEISIVILVIGILIAGISQAIEMFSEASLTSARNLSKSSRISRIDDLSLWLDATSDKAFDKEKDDGSTISMWKDTNPRSTSPASSNSSSASLYPSYILSAISSLPAVRFKKTSATVGNCVTIPSQSFVNNSEDFTLYLIFNPKTLDDGIILEKNNATATNFPFSLELNSGFYKFSVKNSANTIGITNPKQAIINAPNLIRLSRTKGSQIEITVNGVSSTQSDTLTSSTLNTTELAIGCRNGTSPTSFISGDIGEIAFFDRNLSVKEKADIDEYFYKKWKMKKFEGTLPGITCTVPTANTNSDCTAIVNTCSLAGGAGYSAKSELPVGSDSFPCDAGYAGTINYNCPSSGGNATIISGSSCAPIVNTCSLAGGAGYSAKSELPVGSASFPCDAGFAGTINYNCPSSGGTATISGGSSCVASPIKCYAIDMAGFRGTNYFGNISADAGAQKIQLWPDLVRFYPNTGYQLSNIPLVNRIKILDAYHGPIIYKSQPAWYIFDFNPIDRSKFSTTSYTSNIKYLSSPDDFYEVMGTQTFTKYARILGYGINTFNCDSGFTGTLTYNCTDDGSTLNPSSGSCN